VFDYLQPKPKPEKMNMIARWS